MEKTNGKKEEENARRKGEEDEGRKDFYLIF